MIAPHVSRLSRNGVNQRWKKVAPKDFKDGNWQSGFQFLNDSTNPKNSSHLFICSYSTWRNNLIKTFPPTKDELKERPYDENVCTPQNKQARQHEKAEKAFGRSAHSEDISSWLPENGGSEAWKVWKSAALNQTPANDAARSIQMKPTIYDDLVKGKQLNFKAQYAPCYDKLVSLRRSNHSILPGYGWPSATEDGGLDLTAMMQRHDMKTRHLGHADEVEKVAFLSWHRKASKRDFRFKKLLITEEFPLIAWYWELVLTSCTTPQPGPGNFTHLTITILTYSMNANGVNLDKDCCKCLVSTAAPSVASEIQATVRIVWVFQQFKVIRLSFKSSHDRWREATQANQAISDTVTKVYGGSGADIILDFLNHPDKGQREIREI
ncbi:hypothetical protein KC351_g11443 [Hortaea werneckii]|nr:hypothetical protein KC351_g11443 [Hortaea werneckii]